MEEDGRRMGRMRTRRRKKRRRTSGNPRVINDFGIHLPSMQINPLSMLPLHRPLQRFTSIDGTASLEDNCWNILKRAETLSSGFQRHVST
eukprot:5943618-Pyramimonas_sp.AAC.1